MLIRVPSKVIQYGYIEREVPDTGTPEGDAQAYLAYVGAFQVAELEFLKAKQNPPEEKPQAPVQAPAEPTPDDEPSDTDEAAQALSEGLGGTTVVEDSDAPWNQADEPATTSNPWDEGPVFDWS